MLIKSTIKIKTITYAFHLWKIRYISEILPRDFGQSHAVAFCETCRSAFLKKGKSQLNYDF